MAKLLKTITKQTETIAALRAELEIAERAANAIKLKIAALEETQLNDMLESGTESVKSVIGQHFIKRATVPEVEDWPVIDKWILKNKALDMLQRRLAITAWRERIEAGIIVPGISPREVITLGWRKNKG